MLILPVLHASLPLLIIIFITFPSTIKADSFKELKKELLEGNKLIFIRHAYAPGGGDPDNFDVKVFED